MSTWDSHPIVVEQRNNNGNYEIVNEITDQTEVEKLINALKHTDWKENDAVDVTVDIRHPDYQFTWNSHKHSVWHDHKYGRMDLIVGGQMSYGILSKDYSEIVFDILTGSK